MPLLSAESRYSGLYLEELPRLMGQITDVCKYNQISIRTDVVSLILNFALRRQR